MRADFYVSTVNVSALMCWRRHDKQWLHLSTQCTWHPVGNSATCAHCDCRKYTILKNQAWNMMACTGQKAASTLFSIGKVTSRIILHHWPPKFNLVEEMLMSPCQIRHLCIRWPFKSSEWNVGNFFKTIRPALMIWTYEVRPIFKGQRLSFIFMSVAHIFRPSPSTD